MKRFAVIIVASLALIGTASVASASAAPPPVVEDGSGPCYPLYSTWETHYAWFDYPYWRFHHVRYACFPWGVEVIDQWDT